MAKFILTNKETGLNPDSEELMNVLLDRMGIGPRKSGSNQKVGKVLLELYEGSKRANNQKRPELAVMTVEDMAVYAGITRQTMYDYIKRWNDLNLIEKASFIKDGNVVRGYKLNGNTLKDAFEKAIVKINNINAKTMKYVEELQRKIKNEKIKKSQSNKKD